MYLVASQVAPKVLDALEGQNVVLYHANSDEFHEEMVSIIRETGRHAVLFAGGETGVHKGLELGRALGYRDIKMFGFDASGVGHAYKHARQTAEQKEVTVAGKTFSVTDHHIRQAGQYEFQHKKLTSMGVRLRAYGSSLIPTICRKLNECTA
jgi:hypothetical protein